jgi:pilus assembly protein Flp/PilA
MNNLVLRAACFAQSLATVSKDRSGVTAMEYGLIAALISLLIIAGATTGGTAVQNILNDIGSELTKAAAKF